MEISREDHLQWCKDRALEYVALGDLDDAIASMLSDLRKCPDTTPQPEAERLLTLAILFYRTDQQKVIQWINGFN